MSNLRKLIQAYLWANHISLREFQKEIGNFHKETVEDARAFIREITKTVDKNTVIKEKEAVRRFYQKNGTNFGNS